MKIGDRVIVGSHTYKNKGTIMEIRKLKSNGYAPEYLISVDNVRPFIWTIYAEIVVLSLMSCFNLLVP